MGTFVLLVPVFRCPWGAALNTCAVHIPGTAITPPGPALRQAININIPPTLPSSLKPLAPQRWPRQPTEQPRSRGGTTCFPVPAGCPRMLQTPGGDTGHPAGSPRDTSGLAALFFKLIDTHPLQLPFNLQKVKTTWQDRQGLYINPSGHFIKQTPTSKWPLYLECGFMQVTGQQSSCPVSSQHNGDSRDAISTIFFLPCCALKNLF